jgi:hypothetical protein
MQLCPYLLNYSFCLLSFIFLESRSEVFELSRASKKKVGVDRPAVEYVNSILSLIKCNPVINFLVSCWYLLSYDGLVQPLNVTEYFIRAGYILFASFCNVQDSLYVLLDTGTISNGIFTGRGTNHSTPSSSPVKNELSYSYASSATVLVAGARINLSFFYIDICIFIEILIVAPVRNFSDVSVKRALYEHSCRRNENKSAFYAGCPRLRPDWP